MIGSRVERFYTPRTTYAQITKVTEVDTRHNEVVGVDDADHEWIISTGVGRSEMLPSWSRTVKGQTMLKMMLS